MEQECDREDVYMLTKISSDIKPKRPWFTGSKFKLESELPLRFKLNSTWGNKMSDFFEAGIPVFSKKLLNNFRAAGVDNLDAYEAEMYDDETGQVWGDYFAVNVIGSVSCANMDESSYRDPTGSGKITVFFKNLVIDPSKTNGMLCFRLMESLGDIIVHERVVNEIDLTQYVGLKFTKLQVAT